MNYLKKKINKHKQANRNHDDDDVYDYIPAVPLHPDELARKEAQEAAELNGLSEEEIQARLEKKRQLEEKKKQQEEAKKGQEAWKFFEQLNLRVSETVTKSQSVIDNLKDSTTADELIKQAEEEAGFAAPDSPESPEEKGATFKKGSWVAFAEGAPFDEPFKSPSSEQGISLSVGVAPPVPPPSQILEPESNLIPVEELLAGFVPPEETETFVPPEEEGDDPFDTSYVSVSVVDSKQAAKLISSSSQEATSSSNQKKSLEETSPSKTETSLSSKPTVIVVNGSSSAPDKEYSLVKGSNVDLGLDLPSKTSPSDLPTTPEVNLPPGDPVPDSDFDPDVADLYLQQTTKKIHHVSRYGSTTSLASILSNPFLNEDFTDDYNPGIQSNISSGAATPTKRRGSTNPFEDPSPEEEEPPEKQNQATAIAALTADFCSAIEFKGEEDKQVMNKSVVEEREEQEITNEIEEPEEVVEIVTEPPPPPPSTEPFDPFATITDDSHEDIHHHHLNPQKLPDYPSDVSDTEDPEIARVTEVMNEERVMEEEVPPEVLVAGESARRRSSAFKGKEASDSKRSSTSSLEVNSHRRASKPFDPFEQVDEAVTPVIEERDGRSFEPREENEDEEQPDSSKSEKPSESEAGIVNEAFEDYPPPPDNEPENKVEDEEEVFPPPPKEIEIPDFSDPNIDPFDTTNFSFEPVADAVEVTDTGTFDAFSDRFDKTGKGASSVGDAFSSPLPQRKGGKEKDGFDSFDPFAGVRPPTSTPIKMKKEDSKDSFSDDEEEHFKIVIKAKMRDPAQSTGASIPVPLLPPPPKTPVKAREKSEFDEYDFINKKLAKKEERLKEFAEAAEKTERAALEIKTADKEVGPPVLGESGIKRTDSGDSPSTPLYDEDISQPLEEFPAKYSGDGWEMFIRYPAKKKLTGNRFWKKIFVRVSENSVVQLFNTKEDADPFQELPLQPSYSLSEISAQQYDQFGKIFTVKLQYVFYRERVGVRKGQIAKVIQGQITSIGSIAKLGMPLDHAPQVSELIKLGTHVYEDARSLQQVVEEALFRMPLHRDRALTYKTEEIQITVQDDYYVEQNRMGIIQKQLARVRLFFIAFLNGMPGVEIGVNDMTRQGKEIVGRYDIIPVVTEEWIRLEDYEFHSCVMLEEFEKTRTIKLIPPDACYFELMRFRVRPPKNRELPLQVSCNLYVTKRKVELRCEILVPGAVSRKHGQIPCEDIVIRVHIPEVWIYFFRTEKHMRYGAVKSTARRPGKLKGLDRFLGAAQNLEKELLETSAGSAKYEHVFHSLVWRIPRLPKEGQGAYTQQLMTMTLPLTSFDQVPETFYEFVHVEFTMPSTTVSHAVVRSVSVTAEEPPEKYVRNVSRHEYKVEMGIHFDYEEENAFMAAATIPTSRKTVNPTES